MSRTKSSLSQEQKEVLSFAKECSKLGVKEFHKHKEGYSIRFHAPASLYPGQEQDIHGTPKPIKVSSHARRAADEIERKAQKKTDRDLKEEERADMLVLSPEDYEDEMIGELSDGTEPEQEENTES